MPNKYMPISMTLANRKTLVVGGGKVALRKVNTLLDYDSSVSVIAPELVDKLFGESYRRVSECVHKQNKKLIWHSCGNIYKFLDYFVDWGFDGIITMEPTAGMELAKVRAYVELLLGRAPPWLAAKPGAARDNKRRCSPARSDLRPNSS